MYKMLILSKIEIVLKNSKTEHVFTKTEMNNE